MPRVRQIAVLLLSLVSLAAFGQRRYLPDGSKERDIFKAKGFTTRDVSNKTDALGLHASMYQGERQYLGISVDGGWGTFYTNTPYITRMTPGGWTAGGSLVYEYHIGLLFLQTGLGASYREITTPVDVGLIDEYFSDGKFDSICDNSWRTFENKVNDPWDDAEYMLINRFDKRTDISKIWYLKLPINVGYYIAGTYGLGYLMLGAQLNYAIAGKSLIKSEGSTYARFDVEGSDNQFIGEWTNIPSRGLRKDVPFAYKGAWEKFPAKVGKSMMGFDVLAHIEGGYEYNTYQKIRHFRVKRADKMDCRLRVSAFADVSLGNLYKMPVDDMFSLREGFVDADLLKFYDSKTTPFELTHIYASNMPKVINDQLKEAGDSKAVKDIWLGNLTVGVRFTVLFSLQVQEHAIISNPYKVRRYR